MTVFHRLNVAAIERETPDAVAITLRVPEGNCKTNTAIPPAST